MIKNKSNKDREEIYNPVKFLLWKMKAVSEQV
jgi:hypothetical protein